MNKMKNIVCMLCVGVLLSVLTCSAFAAEPTLEGTETSTQSVSVETTEPTNSPEPTTAPSPTAAPVEAATPVPTAEPVKAAVADTLTIDFAMNPTNALPSIGYFELYDTNGALLDYTSQAINNTTTGFTLTFRVPTYEVGKVFRLKLAYGMKAIQYYDTFAYVGQSVDIKTYAYTDANGQNVIGNHFLMTAYADLEKKVNLYIDGKLQPVKSRMIDGTLMVPVLQTAPLLGITDVKLDYDYNSVRVAVGKKDILFNIGSTYTTLFGGDWYTPVATTWMNDDAYVQLRLLAEAFHCPLAVYDHYDYMDVMLSRSQDAEAYVRATLLSDKERYIHNAGLTSQTDYLIWVSKANYEVNVFHRSGGLWKLIDAIPCAIGTDETPTCVGTYRYYEKIPRWKYPDFYVGPVMRFNGGYAIHSTLLKYDGTNYNASVRKKLSHGCIRVRPNKMNWLAATIPMYTTIHVTNE